MPKNLASQLAKALRGNILVKFTRPFEEGAVKGYVLDIGPQFFLTAVLAGDGIWFNGFQCFRLTDVRGLQVPHKYAAFNEAVLKKRRQGMPTKPRVSVASIQDLLQSANRAFPLVTIHREKADPDVCHIGRVVGLAAGRVSLLEIGPDAAWDKKPETYRLSQITRVDFGGDYEEGLHLIGGRPKRDR